MAFLLSSFPSSLHASFRPAFRHIVISGAVILGLSLVGCGGHSPYPGGYSGNPWERTGQEQQAQQSPDTLDLRGQWLGAHGSVWPDSHGAGGPAQPAMEHQTAGLYEQPALYPHDPVSGQQSHTPFFPTAGRGAQKIKVALLVPMSGPNAAVGEAIVNASQLALFDVGGDTFEIMPRDTKGTASGAYHAAETALAEGAQLILGPLFAEEVRAVAPLAASKRVNVIAFTTDWKQAGQNVFVMGFLPFGQVQRVVDYAASQGLQRIGVVAAQTEYGDAVLSAYNARARQTGLTTIDEIRFRPGDTTLGPVVERFARYEARKLPDGRFEPAPFDAVFMPIGGMDAQTIANLLSYYEMEPAQVRRLGTGLWDDAAMAREASLNGGWFAAPDPKSRAGFDNKYREAYGTSAPRLASLGYDATALAAVLARSGIQRNNTPDFNRSAIINPNGFAGIDGIFRFRPDGLAERGLAVLEIRNGRTIVIDPAPRSFQRVIGHNALEQGGIERASR